MFSAFVARSPVARHSAHVGREALTKIGSARPATLGPLPAYQAARALTIGRARQRGPGQMLSAPRAGTPADQRPKLVILGSGWAAMEVLQNMDSRALSRYHIHVCSMSNHFVNTPLLPSVCVGTLEGRSVVEPVRNVLMSHRKRTPETSIKFNEVVATQIDYKDKRVKVQTRGTEGLSAYTKRLTRSGGSAAEDTEFWVDYDVLVTAVGATTNTFGTPGALEHCAFLKTVTDALKLRAAILDCFEAASTQGTPNEDIDRLLSFVVIGAGPTGVEVAAELRDFVKEDVITRYSGFSNREIKVSIVEMGKDMLGAYEKQISDYAADRFRKQDIDMYMQHKVTKVNPKSVEALDLKTGETKVLPFGVCVWASGVRPNSVSLDLAKDLQGARMLEVDRNLRVIGCEGSIFAVGDCARIVNPTMRSQAEELFKKADVSQTGRLTEMEFHRGLTSLQGEFPQLDSFLSESGPEPVTNLFKKALATCNTPAVTFEEWEFAMGQIDKYLHPLPPTAQVAAQQGAYLAKIFNGVPYEQLCNPDGFDPAFEYKHAGKMAYIGGEHAVISSPIFGISRGLVTYVLWKGVYWGKSISLRMKLMMLFDWAKTWFLGRDTSRF